MNEENKKKLEKHFEEIGKILEGQNVLKFEGGTVLADSLGQVYATVDFKITIDREEITEAA